ncbi:MAG: hypothetical protein ACXW6K_24320, partial [Candidatus Binatia bacterium]
MVLESSPWKQELSRRLDSVQKWASKCHTQRGYCIIERAIFLSSFIVWKLIENRKVTDKIRNRSICCDALKPLRPLSDRVSRFSGVYDTSKEYDLNHPEPLTLSVFDLSSEAMHSYVFEPEVNNESSLVTFYVNSYRHKDDRVLRVDLVTYLSAARAIVSDEVVDAGIRKDPKTGRIHA